jgi:hypothetical protein
VGRSLSADVSDEALAKPEAFPAFGIALTDSKGEPHPQNIAIKKMKAVQVTEVGGPEVLVLREVPNPVPGKREVLIRIAASGVNFVDIYVRSGHYGSPLPFILPD